MRYGQPWTAAEDSMLRNLVGKHPAEVIAVTLNRPKAGVHHRIKKLGLSGRLVGEHHWAAKVDSLQAAMIGALKDAGFTAQEIRRAFDVKLSVGAINDIGRCSTWKV